MNTLAERIKFLLEQTTPITRPVDLARHCKISPPSVADWLSGKTKKLEGSNLLSVAGFFKCNQVWLATGKGKPFPPKAEGSINEINLENNQDYKPIKKVKVRLSAGISGYEVEHCEDDDSSIFFKADWYSSRGLKPDKLLATKVSGESMEPSLYAGDMVVFNTADTELRDGDVYVFLLDGAMVIKRAAKDLGQWWLDSDNKNPKFSRKACPDDLCIVVGKVVHKQSERI